MARRLSHPRSARLLTGADFKAVFDQRRAIANDWFRIHYADAEQARLGMAVSRRVSPRAVVRNRVRRQIRESFRLRRPDLANMHYVVLAKPAAARCDADQLRQALDQLWSRFIG
ncbi:MAG: ribonuclease P protein component [Pseudomonadota bacterium]